jgi:hypothetical protein
MAWDSHDADAPTASIWQDGGGASGKARAGVDGS